MVLCHWLTAQKYSSKNFVNKDYVEKMFFQSGVLVVYQTNKLKAPPSVFDFSSYVVGCTDQPKKSTFKDVAERRGERVQQCPHLAEQREVTTEEQ